MLDGEISYACHVHHIQVGIIRHVGWANSTSSDSPEDGQPPEPPVSQSTVHLAATAAARVPRRVLGGHIK